MYVREQRALNDREKRSLGLSVKADRKSAKIMRQRAFLYGPLVIVVLWAITVLVAGKSALLSASLLWLGIGIPICIASGAESIRPFRKRVAEKEAVLANGRVEETRIQADSMVELQEVEDGGACYAFQVDPDRIVFVCGQDFYEGPKFPSSDFSLVSILGNNGQLVDLIIEKRGEKLRPIRTIRAEARKGLREPSHLEELIGKLDQLEELLRAEGVS